MKTKHIYAIDLVLIVGTFMGLIFLVGYSQPLVISPLNEFETTNSSVLFSIEGAEFILIDDNNEFTSPEKFIVEDGLMINLKPGVYYWKVESVLKSEVRKLTINSEVDLKLKELGEGYEITNAGNTRLDVEVYNGTSLISKIKLDTDEEKNVFGTKFVGGWGNDK
ncbi:hypothetical protein KAI32_02295 [Candidatus Pacearchaeota archaeon]|nr:hypothetical protein [Candidatus Pacearchaeota archaeon]